MSKLYTKGHAVLTAVIFFTGVSLAVAIGASAPALKAISTARLLGDSHQSFFAAESVAGDMFRRLDQGISVDETETLSVGATLAEATLQTDAGVQTIVATGDAREAIRSVSMTLASGAGAAFFYGVQAGEGGIDFNNSSFVSGNVFSNGPVTGSGNLVKGTVASAGPTGLVDGIHATSSAYAHTIRNSTIDGNAYYQSISNTTVLGTLNPGSPDQATSSMPISDETITTWKSQAEAGGVHASPCPYSISGTVTLGPKKINCNLTISGSAVITLDGPLWVVGDITISNTADIKVNPALGNSSVAIIADNPAQPTSRGLITLSNSVEFIGAGSNSFILLVSMNTSASQGGSTQAITISNSANGDLLLYAPYGEIRLSNSVSLREVTGYRLTLNNTAEVIYETGLANLIFTSGPGGGYSVESWSEVE